MKVSVIIPVYNVEKYVRKCLESVEKQTYLELEVIVINDGSTDGSYEIIKEYVKKNDNFQCWSIENRGLGGARNYGVEKAKGEYLFFLDSDDYIAVDCIEKLVGQAQKDESDIVACGNYDVWENGEIICSYMNKYEKNPTNLYNEPKILFNRVSAWGKLYRKKMFEGLKFVSRGWYEDMRLIPKLYLRAKKISYVDEGLVYYVQRKGSIMNNSSLERNLEIIDAFEDIMDYYKKQGVYGQFQKELEFLVIEHVAVAGISRVARGGKEGKKVIQRLQEYLNTYENLYDNSYIDTMEKNRKIILFCNRRGFYGLTKLFLTMKGFVK